MSSTPSGHIKITANSRVWLHFSVALENGVELDNSRRYAEPVELVIGDGSLLPGFEAMIMGLQAGDRRSSLLMPAEAFGEHNSDNVQQFDRVKFASDIVVGSLVEFEDKGKNTLFGVVADIGDNLVTVDFNHPVAGKSVFFEVEVFKVLPADSAVVHIV